MFRTKLKLFVVLLGAAILSLKLLAQTAFVTNVVGQTNFNVNSNSDRKSGITLSRTSSFVGAVESISGGEIVVGTGKTVPNVTNETHYLKVTSGALLGLWAEVIAYSNSTVTVAEDLQAGGFAPGDTFELTPFWTLDTLFPDGGDIPKSSDPFNPDAFILLNDPTLTGINLSAGSVYFYYDGSLGGSAGWYDNDNLMSGPIGSDVYVVPGAFMTVRNQTDSALVVATIGNVPAHTTANQILSSSTEPQDTQIANPFPVGVSLGDSNLFEDGVIRGSPNVFSPRDFLLIFEDTPSAFNPSATKVVFYHDGTQGPAGWYDNDNLVGGVIDDYILSPSVALIVRRGVGADTLISWSPSIPYESN